MKRFVVTFAPAITLLTIALLIKLLMSIDNSAAHIGAVVLFAIGTALVFRPIEVRDRRGGVTQSASWRSPQ